MGTEKSAVKKSENRFVVHSAPVATKELVEILLHGSVEEFVKRVRAKGLHT